MSSYRAQHLFRVGKCAAGEPSLSSALQLRSLQACSYSALRLPSQCATHFCPYCSVAWVPGWTLSVSYETISTSVRQNRLNKRARARRRKNRSLGSTQSTVNSQITYRCLKCQNHCLFDVPRLEATTKQDIPAQEVAKKPSKKRSKSKKQNSSLQQMLANEKPSSSKSLKLDDFMKPS